MGTREHTSQNVLSCGRAFDTPFSRAQSCSDGQIACYIDISSASYGPIVATVWHNCVVLIVLINGSQIGGR